ncbi:MAG: autotransporter outer membrane beta-barrel domain-containing protein, partial [Clostridia bacterium]|nr:autotransporter outer membrane beta-barrel domain-containing protein [Clostridia bacterium]
NIDFNGFFDPVDASVDGGHMKRGDYDDDIRWTVEQNATLTYLKDKYLFDSAKHDGSTYHKNSITLHGGTLDLANGIVSEVHLANFTLTEDSFLSLDADLANGTIDKIISDTVFDNTGNYIITISNMNLINPQETEIDYKFGDNIDVSIKCDNQFGDYKVYYVDGKFTFTYNPQGNKITKTQPLATLINDDQKAQSGAVSATTSTVASVQNVLNGRMMGGFKSAPSNGNNSKQKTKGKSSGDEELQYGLWAQGLYNYTDKETTAKATGFTAKTTGIVVGFDAKVSDTITAGIGYSFAKSDISGGTDVDTHTFMLYGQYNPSDLFFNASIGYGISKTELNDNTDYDSNIATANAMVGYEMGDLTPYAEGRYMYLKSDDYKRNNEKFEAKSANTLTGVTGVRWSHDFGKVKPNVAVAATYDFVSKNNKVLLKEAGFAVETERTKRLGGEVKAGVEAQLTNNWSVSADYTGNFKTHYQSHTGTISATYNF